VAVGNLPVEELIQIVAEGFTEATSSQGLAPQQQPAINPEPPFTEIVRREFVDDSLQQARLVMVWRAPGMAELNQTYSLDVLAAILGHGRTSRLVRDLREERGLVSHISASNMTQRLQGIFYISAHLPVENLQVVEAAIAEHLRQLQNEAVQAAEIARVRTQVANRFIFGNETPSDRAGLYGYYQSMLGDLQPAFNYPGHIQSQEAPDLTKAAQQYLSPDAYGVVVLKPSYEL
jgi:predicted Zn-dependent peptidase